MSRPEGNVEGEAPASHATRRSKVTPERVALVVLCGLLAAAFVVVYRVSFDNWTTSKALQTLKEENEALRKDLTETKPYSTMQPTILTDLQSVPSVELRAKCKEGWEQHGGWCYYFTTNKSSWGDSRHFCQRQGGDLVKIDSEEEQIFLKNHLTQIMDDFQDMFWIGLTDSEEEGTWLWVDGSPLNTSLSFWSEHEPDNWSQENPGGEDCARLGQQLEEELKSWYDHHCEAPQKSICEKHG